VDDPGGGVAQWRTDLPAGRVARLPVGGLETAGPAGPALPDGGPALVTCRPPIAGSPAAAVAAILDQLDAVAVALFPAWLPGAARLNGPGGAGVAAVRALAREAAGATAHFGPFLADLAVRSLRPGPKPAPAFPAEVRAAGLARVIAAGHRRPGTALLVDVPDRLGPAEQVSLMNACEWLAGHGRFAVWLTGAATPAADQESPVRVGPPPRAAAGPSARAYPDRGHPAGLTPAGVTHPPLTGRPHPGSRAEQRLEAALAGRAWAAGRAWNQPYQSRTLTNPITVDLIWEAERCVVEIDGPEHCDRPRFEQDRRRDVHLQLDGYSVLRFTNAQVLGDLGTVLSQIEQFVTTRRLARPEG
jgi:very-short-patch-repair endonuclease